MDNLGFIRLFQFVQIVGQTENDFFGATFLFDDQAGQANAAFFADRIELRTGIAVFEELLEGQHTAGNINIGKLDAGLGKSLFHRGTAGSVHTGIHDDLFHFVFFFLFEIII